MNKPLLLAAAGLMLSAAALAAPAWKTMGDNYVIPIKTGAPGENPESGRPRVPALIWRITLTPEGGAAYVGEFEI